MPGHGVKDHRGGYASFVAFVEARQRSLLRSAYLLTGDHHLAEDLLQVALTKLALRWERVRHGDPEAFVRKVLYHEMVSWWRRHRRERLEQIPPERSEADAADAADRRVVLERALCRLTHKQRAVLVLRFYDDLTEAQTAELLGVSVGTVKSQAHAALQRLRVDAPELGELLWVGKEPL
jgi:RNA polymerase sigma-70 factor (sigma-E family)